MNILKFRNYIIKVNENIFKVSGIIALVAFVYHSIANRISKKFSKKRCSIPTRCDFRLIGSYYVSVLK